ncbi:hypothetical protein Ais01nite_70490 [Asanoa ishikariensis]|uniref:Uncharacterized protein n=1 Tax=Asanoa ishikariensis TaxID=137265 RepID=A0A1H3UMS0_9ACTN|nr:hypothetical protein [Asanoa ishikariensis]GIF69014.1 hypothetical protein Ais01nite_70490 [Asanoa ishikariensis]SDZ63733.1 hypothetical protein SAMN05421684_7582 [Asanoa ishikariensis]
MPAPPPLLRATWPTFAAELAAALDEPGLKDQVDRLRVVEECGCGDDFCRSFHTAPKPTGPYSAGHRNLELPAPWPGYLILDVVDDEIVFVEVLYRSPLN